MEGLPRPRIDQPLTLEGIDVVNLLHEIWKDYDDNQQPLEGCCLSGPDGDGFRRLLGPDARLVHTFEASSHYEAMKIYHHFLGRGDYTTDQAWDMEPYPIEWKLRQQ